MIELSSEEPLRKLYIQKSLWPDFVVGDQVFPLSHLDEAIWQAKDTKNNEHAVIITYSDHCFTREAEPDDDPAFAYPQATRRNGHFCVDRYRHSLQLRSHIEQAPRVWNMDGAQFAVIPTVDHEGQPTLYGIIFTFKRIQGLPASLHMWVKSAYPCTKSEVATHGFIRFPYLVSLVLEGKAPKRNFDHGRQRPRLA